MNGYAGWSRVTGAIPCGSSFGPYVAHSRSFMEQVAAADSRRIAERVPDRGLFGVDPGGQIIHEARG